MRIRWFRVARAVVVIVGGPPALGVAGLWMTRGTPTPLERSIPGPDRCVTSEVLMTGSQLHENTDGVDAGDRLAADVLLRAARCSDLGEIDWEEHFEVFEMVRDGVEWIAANEDGEVGLDHALRVWELAADQRRAGPLANVGVWTALGTDAGEAVERRLPEAGDAARTEAERRLVAIATAPIDWDEIAVRDERSMWRWTLKLVGMPGGWRDLPFMPWTIMQARRGSHPLNAELRDEEATTRVEAAVLAGAAELSLLPRHADETCPEHLAVADALGGVRLTVDPELCVVAGGHGDEIRMAYPWSVGTLRTR